MAIKSPTTLALISIACPFVFALAILFYMQIENAPFWNSIGNDEADHVAGALFSFAEVVQFVLASLVGCIFGLVFAVISLVKKNRFLSVGLVGLILNSMPFIALVAILLGKGI